MKKENKPHALLQQGMCLGRHGAIAEELHFGPRKASFFIGK